MPNTIFVLGMDDFNRAKLDQVERHSDHEFRGLFSLAYILEQESGNLEDLLAEAYEVLEGFQESEGTSIDGVIAYWDFPVQTMLPIVRERFGLPGPSLESMLRCEHKFWSRMEQKRVIPDHVPEFQWFDPFEQPVESIELDFPYWIKPVKAANSRLGFMIRNRKDLNAAVATIREGVGRFGHWFDQFLARADVPGEVAGVGGRHCMAESIVRGSQHTLSGWVADDSIQTYGVVDSYNYPDRSSFFRYQYPSKLPPGVQERMAGISALLMDSLGFRYEAFNVEFFYDEKSDHIAVLEVNPRISQSHGDLYEKVDGAPNHKIAADLSLGRIPDFPYRRGRYAYGAKFYLRAFEDAVVSSAPTEEDVRRVQEQLDDALVDVRVAAGDHLAETRDRDSYSFELAHIYLGGDSEDELLARYERCVELLEFELTPT